MKKYLIILMTLALLVPPLFGCAAPGSTSPTSEVAKTGIVQMWVTDAPRTDNVSEIWVTVSDVKIHEAAIGQVSDNGSDEADGEIDDSADTGGWISVNLTGPSRFDLLTLRGETGGLQQVLATANLTEGRYTQIRMTVDEVEVKINGVLRDATLPSGKLKFVHPFDVQADSITKLLFDFDADKFINVTGSPKEPPKIIVKPVVKLIVSKPKPAAESGVKITTPSLPNGAVGASYNVTLSATGGAMPYTWSLLSGNLTDGLTLSPAGNILGTPDVGTADDYTFAVKVSDNSTPVKSDTKQYKITIAEAGALIITTTSLVDGKEGVAYTAALGALGGALPYSWSINGTLPNDLALNSVTGVISGSPTKKGNYNFTAQVSDNATPVNTDSQQLSIRITEI